MFQLIVAVISIALVAALALASIFYGGDAFTRSSLKANVTTMVNQAQQISGAHTLYKTDNAQNAADVQALVDGEYLSEAPAAPAVAADGAVWTLDTAAGVVEVALEASDLAEITEEVNKQAGGVDGDGNYYFPL